MSGDLIAVIKEGGLAALAICSMIALGFVWRAWRADARANAQQMFALVKAVNASSELVRVLDEWVTITKARRALKRDRRDDTEGEEDPENG